MLRLLELSPDLQYRGFELSKRLGIRRTPDAALLSFQQTLRRLLQGFWVVLTKKGLLFGSQQERACNLFIVMVGNQACSCAVPKQVVDSRGELEGAFVAVAAHRF